MTIIKAMTFLFLIVVSPIMGVRGAAYALVPESLRHDIVAAEKSLPPA